MWAWGIFFAGADFNPVTQSLIFTPKVTEFAVSVQINEDLIAEGTEQLLVTLRLSGDPPAMIVRNTSTLFITDDDGRHFYSIVKQYYF